MENKRKCKKCGCELSDFPDTKTKNKYCVSCKRKKRTLIRKNVSIVSLVGAGIIASIKIIPKIIRKR